MDQQELEAKIAANEREQEEFQRRLPLCIGRERRKAEGKRP